MKNLIQQLGVGDTFKLNAIATVEELSHHDMIYIYHHLRKGTVLALKLCERTLSGDLKYSVNYRDYLLGYVKVTGVMKSFYGDENVLSAEIINYKKDQYMPFKQLDIQIGMKALKKVG